MLNITDIFDVKAYWLQESGLFMYIKRQFTNFTASLKYVLLLLTQFLRKHP
jgi:hypothetical protein